jgi:hypothetical protein
MPIEIYYALVDQICAQSNIPDPASMYSAANLQVQGVNFTMFYGGAIAPDSAMVYCDFGELPAQAREAVLLRLLETNMYLFGVNSPVFTYNPENKHIVLVCRVLLARATADRVLDLLAQYAGIAKEWRNGYFLIEKEQQTGMLANNPGHAPNNTLKRVSMRLGRTSESA